MAHIRMDRYDKPKKLHVGSRQKPEAGKKLVKVQAHVGTLNGVEHIIQFETLIDEKDEVMKMLPRGRTKVYFTRLQVIE